MATLPSRRTQITVVAWMSGCSMAVHPISAEIGRYWSFDQSQVGVLDPPRVEHQPRRVDRRTVTAVADDRVAGDAEVTADLMRPPGADLGLDDASLARPDDRCRVFAVDWRVDRRFALDRRIDPSQIDLAKLARCEHPRQPRRRFGRPRKDDDAT